MSEKDRTLQSNIAPFGLRMQPELREIIEASARANERSMNAEIVSRLQSSETLNSVFYQHMEHQLEATKRQLAHTQRQLSNRSMDDLSRNLQLGLPPALFSRLEQAAATNGRSVEQELVSALEAAYPPPAPFSLDWFRSEWLERIAVARGDEREKLIDQANEVLAQHGGFFEVWYAKPTGRNDPGEVVISMINREDRE